MEKESFIGGCAHTKFCEGIPYEFGPQILFTDEERLQKIFEEFLTNRSPPTKDTARPARARTQAHEAADAWGSSVGPCQGTRHRSARSATLTSRR